MDRIDRMSTNNRKPTTEIILEEISLEGLEGITLECFWRRVSDAFECQEIICDKLRDTLWNWMINTKNLIEYYELPVSRPLYIPFDRYADLDGDYGIPIATKEHTPIHKFNPICEQNIRGSCEFFKERKLIEPETIKSMSYYDVEKKWGNKFVMVTNQITRERFLIDETIPLNAEINNFQYCVLEYIGRSRYNGEITAGKRSLQNICNDSTIIFYIRNKLVSIGYCKKQIYTEKAENRLMTSSLLTLTRFFRENKTSYENLIERFFNVLVEQPNKSMPFLECKTKFPEENLKRAVKKVVYTPYFRKIFEIKHEQINNDKGETKLISFIKLRNPEMTIDDLWVEEKIDNEEDDVIEFVDESNFYCDMPLIPQTYRAIDKFGKEGCSQMQIIKYMALPRYTVRALMKTILSHGIVSTYIKDVGRQRVKMYVTIKNTVDNEKTEDADKVIDMLANMKCDELPEHLKDSKVQNKNNTYDSSKVLVTCKEVNWDKEKAIPKTGTDDSMRQVKRKNAIVNIVNENYVISIGNLKNLILKNEAESGYKFEICKKSVVRCLHWLCLRKIVRFFEVNIKYEENSQTTRYVCHPSIDANHPVLIDQINVMKNDYLVTLDERKQKQESSHNNSSKSLTQFKTEKMNLLNFNIRLPKFLISRFFHEFLFYLTYDIQTKTTPILIDDEVTNRWKEFNPKANYILEIKNNCKCENELLYQNEVNWKMFVPPLPKYEDKPKGWVYLPDIIERIPLSVFSKIFQIDKVLTSKTYEYLQDPILQHILVKYLPCNEITVNKRLRMQCTYMTILKVLNNTGLIQIGERHFKDPLQIWIYSNRKTRLLDTTTSQPSTSFISDQEYEKIDYNFKNLQDVQEYWTTLHRISLQTQLGCITKTKSKPKPRSSVTLLPAVSFYEAIENDLGIPPGDKIGAGGIDSRLCSYLGIFWSWRIPTKKVAKSHKIKSIRSRIFVTKIDNKKVKKRARIIIGATKKSQQKTKRQSKPKLSYACDEIDKDALKHMSSIRVKWCADEDHFLKLTRAAFSYLNPSLNLHNSFLSLHEVSKIQRDIMRSILHSYNKTSISCLRRTQFLMKRFRNTQEVPLWLHILQQNKFIQMKYGEHFFNNLKNVYADPLKYEKALRVHFVLLIGYLMQLIEKTTSPFHNSDKNIIPDTLKEFHASFKELSKVNETVEIIHRNPLNNEDIQISTLYNLVHSSLCCTRDKTTYEIQLFEIYKNYPEEILQKAFKHAKTNGLVVINKRRFLRPSQSQLTQLTGPWYIFSNKYRLQLTYIGIPYNVLSMCSENLEKVFKIIFGDGNTIKFKASNSGQLFFISELMMNQQFQFDLKMPSNILTFDPNAQSPTMSDPERILEHFRQIFENAPKTEYVKYFENELDKQPTIKFNIANERYKIDYNPYDIISKLSDIYIHFFCALDNLYHPAALDFPNLKEDNVCPFNCILKKDNYLTEIERIVHEKESIINSLDSKSADDNDNADTELLDSIAIIKPENLMHVFETFKTLVDNKNADINRKDFGKIQLKSNNVDILGICKEIHAYNDDEHLTKSSEFEPTLTKEERIFKAQDVFVVNLPTVEISYNSKYPEIEEFIYKDSKIPKQFAQPIEERTKILKKITRESVWIDNQKTEEYLFEQMKLEDFTELEESFTTSVLKYIKGNELGVEASQLLERFKDEVALDKSINFLRKEYFVMRVGVESFVYVYKSYLDPWIIKTYHIKRLEREAIKSVGTENYKRKPEDDENNIEQTSNSAKRVKLDDPKVTNEEKRLSKPVMRYSECEASTSSANYLPKDRVPILLRPCPWIRVNGSINRRVLDKLIGCILLECVTKCGCTIKSLCGRFNLLHPVDIMFLLEILKDIGCLTLNARSEETVSIFSEYKEPNEYPATQFTSMENAYICTSATAITNIALFIGEKKYTTDFI